MCGLITSRGELKIGEVTVPYFVVTDELLILTVEGVNALIDAYFKDLKGIKFPISFYFELGENKGYFVEVLRILYSHSTKPDEPFIQKMVSLGFAEYLRMVDCNGNLPKGKPELSPADLEKLDRFLLQAKSKKP